MGLCGSVEKPSLEQELGAAAAAGKHEQVKALLAQKADACWAELDTGLTALHHAAKAVSREHTMEEYMKIVQMLTAANANVNAVDRVSSMTPIMYAVRTQKTRLVNFLLEKKADVKVVDGRGCSVLYFAVSEGAANSPTDSKGLAPEDSTIVKVLLNAKANLDVCESATGLTPLHVAIRNDRVHLLQIMLSEQYKCNVNAQAKNGNTPLHYAARIRDKPNVFKALLGAKADLSIKNGEGLTCVDLAQQEKNNLALDMFAALEHQQPQEQHEGNDHEQE